MKKSKWRYTGGCAVVALALLAASCGSDSKDSSSTAGSSGTTAAASSGDFKLDKALSILAAVEIKGDSAYGIDDYYNGIQLAVEEINADGGVGGKPISLDRVATPIDAQGSVTAFRRAAERSPNVIIGFAGNGVQAITKDLNDAEIPLISQVADSATELGGPAGSEWLFHTYPSVDKSGEAAGQFVVEGLKGTNVGVMHINTPFGDSIAKVASATAKSKGATITATRAYPFDATDLTEEVLAMKGSNAVINVPFPGPLVVQLNQFLQNGINVPTLVPSNAAPLAVSAGLLEPAAMNLLYGLVACNPTGSDTPVAKDFAANFQAKYGVAPSGFASMAYDSVHIAAAAVAKAGSTDNVKLREALATVEYDKGVCAKSYKADARNVLSHQAAATSYAGGKFKTEKIYDLAPATTKAGS